jgi:hypothetical protein
MKESYLEPKERRLNARHGAGMAALVLLALAFSPTFAISRIAGGKLPYFQQPASKGLHYIFSWGWGSSERAARRGGGWFGRVSLS